MARKIALTGILILILAAGGVCAHEKGDLSLAIEPHLGVSFPPFVLLFEGLLPGLDFGLQTTLHYNFTKSFSANVGLGYTGNYHWYFNDEADKEAGGDEKRIFEGPYVALYIFIFPILIDYFYIAAQRLPKQMENQVTADHNMFFGSYLTIPFGLNYAFKAVTLGGGFTGNIPLYVGGKLMRKPYEKSPTFETVTFELLPYLGWYLDIGFPRKKSPDRYATVIRLNGSFFPETAKPSSEDLRESMEPFMLSFFSISMVFKFGVPLTNVGGNKEK